jgi:hypothetical protein
VRVCEEKSGKNAKIAGNGPSGRFKVMFEKKKNCKNVKTEMTAFRNFFEKMSVPRLIFQLSAVFYKIHSFVRA